MKTAKTDEPIVLDAHGRHAGSVYFTRDSSRLISVGQDGAIRLWSVPHFKPDGVIEGHAKGIWAMSFSPDDKQFTTGSTDGTVRIWSYPEGKVQHVLEKQTAGIFTPDGRHLVTFSLKKKVVLFDAATGKELRPLCSGHRGTMTAIAFTPDGKNLLVAGMGPLHRLSFPEGKMLGDLEGHKIVVCGLRVSPDGKWLASTGADGMLRLWSTRNWKEKWCVPLQRGGILQIAFAPKGDVVAVSCDNAIQIFAVKNGRKIEQLEVPIKGVYGLAYSPDGRFLANAGADGRIRIWAR